MTQEAIERIDRVQNLLMDTLEMHQTILERQQATIKAHNYVIKNLQDRIRELENGKDQVR